MKVDDLRNLPYPGFRNIKTALAILICLVLYHFIGREGVMFASISTVICMQDSVERSIREGLNRTIGTIIGGVFGALFVYINMQTNNDFLYFTIAPLGVIILIYIFNLLKIRSSIVIALVVYLVIIVDSNNDSPILYSLNRTIDTIIGIFISVVVNNFFFRPKPDRVKMKRRKYRNLKYQLIRYNQCKSFTWLGGYSRELYIYPENSIKSDRDFDFRITILEATNEESTLTKYKGYMRHLMLLEGESKLVHDGHHKIILDKYSQDFFKGDWDTYAYGKCKDLNLIYKENYSGELIPITLDSIIYFTSDKNIGFYFLEDNIKINLKFDKEDLLSQNVHKQDFLFFPSGSINNTEEHIIEFESQTIEDFDTIIAIKIEVYKKTPIN